MNMTINMRFNEISFFINICRVSCNITHDKNDSNMMSKSAFLEVLFKMGLGVAYAAKVTPTLPYQNIIDVQGLHAKLL